MDPVRYAIAFESHTGSFISYKAFEMSFDTNWIIINNCSLKKTACSRCVVFQYQVHFASDIKPELIFFIITGMLPFACTVFWTPQIPLLFIPAALLPLSSIDYRPPSRSQFSDQLVWPCAVPGLGTRPAVLRRVAPPRRTTTTTRRRRRRSHRGRSSAQSSTDTARYWMAAHIFSSVRLSC